jgi:hypothetical protein
MFSTADLAAMSPLLGAQQVPYEVVTSHQGTLATEVIANQSHYHNKRYFVRALSLWVDVCSKLTFQTSSYDAILTGSLTLQRIQYVFTGTFRARRIYPRSVELWHSHRGSWKWQPGAEKCRL